MNSSKVSASSKLDRHARILRLRLTSREFALAGRLAATLILGVFLLALSAIINIASGATSGGSSLIWITWLVIAFAAAIVAFSAASVRLAWGRLCFIGFLASCILLMISLPWYPRAASAIPQTTADLAQSLGLSAPMGEALGAAILSGAMGIIAVILVVVFLAASYFLLHRRRERHA